MLRNKYLRRLIYFNKKELINPLFHPFMLSTMTWVIGASFFQDARLIDALTLPVWWGWSGLLIMAGNLTTVFLRMPWLSKLVAYFGFLLWMFACWTFVIEDHWIMLLAVSLPHMAFWIWYYLETLRFERLQKRGMIEV